MVKRRKRPLKSHYPAYKQNQLRWALWCYKMNSGVSWESYPWDMASKLGTKEGLPPGLNERDPRGFLVDGQTPTAEKLALFERFIRKAAPEYAKTLDDADFIASLSDFVARFTGAANPHPENAEELVAFASKLERCIFHVPKGSSEGLSDQDQRNIQAIGFQQIGKSYNLRAFLFEMDFIQRRAAQQEYDLFLMSTFDYGPLYYYDAVKTRQFEKAKYKKRNQFYTPARSTIKDFYEGDTPLRNVFSGVVVPTGDDDLYIGLLKDDGMSPCSVHIHFRVRDLFSGQKMHEEDTEQDDAPEQSSASTFDTSRMLLRMVKEKRMREADSEEDEAAEQSATLTLHQLRFDPELGAPRSDAGPGLCMQAKIDPSLQSFIGGLGLA